MTGAFEGEHAVVIGAGIAGSAAARVLSAEGATVRVSEAASAGRAAEDLGALGVEVLDGGHVPEHLDGATLVVPSPGVPPHAEVLRWARERGLPVFGEMELGARIATAPYLAITGTNGKTTTTQMLTACLGASGLDAVACGNIGRPFPAAAREPHDVLVVEVSSFQLETQASFHPRVSVLLNLAPDHLDWHGTLEAYAAAKARIFANQGPGDVHVGNRDDEGAAGLSRSARCDVRWFTTRAPSGEEAGFRGDRLVAGWSETDLGSVLPDTPAMRADAAAGAAAAHAFGVEDEAIARGLDGFAPSAHRGELVAMVEGVRFLDNSKATNPHAAVSAVGDAEGVVLIAGGDAKGVDLSPLAAIADRLAGVVALGAAAGQIRSVFEGRVLVRDAGSIEQAARFAFATARPGGTVLLAPACASWDMFRDYAERGDRFAAAARALEKEAART
ncbi:MAG TPA: UDP-N-acetylmuramoyl-L-alanine--D-glutamate ligase [Actinomycetota bacterium]|nr:UDP-N-acetylmuramoyl-L-alanine--D-glutamate ligase [Actinomycetota bacterium]